MCSHTTTQHLSNNALQVGIFVAVRESLVALLEMGLIKNHIPSLPVSHPESATLAVFEGLMKLLPFWKCGCLGVFGVAVSESAWNGHGNIISVFRKINVYIKLQHTAIGASISMEIPRLAFVSGFAVLASRSQGSQSNKPGEPEVLVTIGDKRKVDLCLQLSD